eukprot:TRINITY_DN3737_c0_g5_i1.p1 TRINITY_DN3737_c0_g5~~TRINITY_DN3737_c0_g5_i1.p1  ORF type:complete len:299 (-),score=35.67 TRINITY_DN3737_c0_g5_i1:44-940(-)
MKQLTKESLAGGAGGMCLVLVGHPLDTIKVRIQTMTVTPGLPPPYTGVVDCALKTIRNEGVLGLYRGMSAPLVGVTPMYMLCFFGYQVGKQIFCTPESFKNLHLVDIALAGGTSGLFTTPILAPLERLKCVLQVQSSQLKPGEKPRFSGPMDLAKHLYKEGGVASVNRGFMSTMLRDSVASMAYFSSYEYIKRKLTPEGATGPNVLGTLFAGGMAGVFNWLPALPIDTLKSRYQTAPEGKYKNGIRSVFSEIVQKEGWNTPKTLYRGFTPVMIRAFPANAACFLGYETAKQMLNWAWP